MGEAGNYAPLSAACVRALNDKIYDKRKAAALEIEKMTRDFVAVGNHTQLKKLLKVLAMDFTISTNSNMRKGGLIGLAAMAIAMGKETSNYTEDLIMPILTCLSDTDSRVRYCACESLYNVIKVARDDIIPLFNDIFGSMSSVITDLDQSVKTGAELLDRLLKDIITETPRFELGNFIPVLKERMYSKDPFARQFHLGWVEAIDKVPDSNLVVYLPDFIDSFFVILSDPNPDIYVHCEKIMGRFLTKIESTPERVDFKKIIPILITHSQSQHIRLQIMAVHWIYRFVKLSGTEMLESTAGILRAVLPNLSNDDDLQRSSPPGQMVPIEKKGIREMSGLVNLELMRLIRSTEEQSSALKLQAVIEELIKQLQRGKVYTKIAALKWFFHLFTIARGKMDRHVEEVFPVMLKTLSDSADGVVILDLQVLAEICKPEGQEHNDHFKTFMLSLLKLFDADRNLLETKGPFIIRQLCVALSAEDIYKRISELLAEERNLEFARHMVETLNSVLLTSPELFEMRSKLKDMASKESAELFCILYRTWCHSQISTVALCLQSGCYRHAGDLVRLISEYEITLDVLCELDRLIQLIESPIFTYVRMELLDADANEDLIYMMYAILMLLPQSTAYNKLKDRLSCIQVPLKLHGEKRPIRKWFKSRKYLEEIDLETLFKHFKTIQDQHYEDRRNRKKEELHAKVVGTFDLSSMLD